MITVKQLLQDAKEHIEKKGHCKGMLWDEEGRCCIIGAVSRVHGPVGTAVFNPDAYFAAMNSIRASIPADAPTQSIPGYNDRPETTKEDILALFDRAIARVESTETI